MSLRERKNGLHNTAATQSGRKTVTPQNHRENLCRLVEGILERNGLSGVLVGSVDFEQQLVPASHAQKSDNISGRITRLQTRWSWLWKPRWLVVRWPFLMPSEWFRNIAWVLLLYLYSSLLLTPGLRLGLWALIFSVASAYLYRWFMVWYQSRKMFHIDVLQVLFTLENVSGLNFDETWRTRQALGPGFSWRVVDSSEIDAEDESQAWELDDEHDNEYGGDHGTVPARIHGRGGDGGGTAQLVWTLTPMEAFESIRTAARAELLETAARDTNSPKRPLSRIYALLRYWIRNFVGSLDSWTRWLLAPSSFLTLLLLLGASWSLRKLLLHWDGYSHPEEGLYRVLNACLADAAHFLPFGSVTSSSSR